MLNPGQFERRVSSLGMVALVGAFVFFGVLTYWQVFRTDLAGEDSNPRVLREFQDPNRGRILDRDGNVLAESLPDGTRRYTDASVAHAVGYIDPRYGSQGAELAFNGQLSGQQAASWEGAFNAEFRRDANRGLDVRLTLDPELQAAAAEALGSRTGAVIALDPKTGQVLAMVSVPTYDPGSLGDSGEALLNDPASPLLNRATQGLYPPGSTFKTVTASSALEHGVITPDTTVTCPGEIVIDGFPISCNNVAQGTGTYPFRNAFAFSVNAIFAQVGVDLGWENLLDTAQRFGFGSELPFTLATARTQVFNPGSDLTKTALASTAFGQGELLATPLQMAVVASTVANGGVLAQPHLGLAAYDGDKRVEDLEDHGTRRILDPEVANEVRDMMVAVVDNGQALGAQIPGVKVAGKTGTAESGVQGQSHAWFIAFAPAEDPVIALAVVVENGGRGGEVASPIAGEILRAALGK
ncbi:MAG: peptidoglycan D,D-transpeptidase FtsI family protein [Hyphomicrobiales bacterium]